MRNVLKKFDFYPVIYRKGSTVTFYKLWLFLNWSLLDILEDLKPTRTLRIIEGAIFSEIFVTYGTLLRHRARIYNSKDTILASGVYIENEVDYGLTPKYHDQEMYMKIMSDIQNGAPPIAYTDANGYHMQKRIKVPEIGIEGNYWPITNVIFIEDEKMRLNLLTDHAQGAAAYQPGVLEVMVDRRMLYQDSRYIFKTLSIIIWQNNI